MRVDMYDDYWIIEVDGYEYNIIGDSDNGYEVIANGDDSVLYYSNKDFEACLIWCYRS